MKLIELILDSGIRDLTVIGADCGVEEYATGVLIANRRVRKVIAGYVGENHAFADQLHRGEIEVELTPMGTLAEKLRCGGAGIPAFFTPTGYGTPYAEGKETRIVGGRGCVLEHALRPELGIAKAFRSDRAGNLQFRKTARNFNPVILTAAYASIVEVEQLVEVGEMSPDEIHLPGIYVDRVVETGPYPKRMERRTVRPIVS
jgi:3-oxoacid CoA-transferase A subunit